MKKHIKKLKNKPDHHKQKLAQTLAIITTVVIVIIWIVIRTLVPEPIQTESIDSGPSIGERFESILDSTSSELADIQQEFNEQPSFFDDMLQQAEENQSQQEIKNILETDLLLDQDEQTNGIRTETTTE